MANICTIEGERKEGICAKMIVRLLLPLLARNRRENNFSEWKKRIWNIAEEFCLKQDVEPEIVSCCWPLLSVLTLDLPINYTTLCYYYALVSSIDHLCLHLASGADIPICSDYRQLFYVFTRAGWGLWVHKQEIAWPRHGSQRRRSMA